MIWGLEIVLYLFLAGLGAGAYATSVVLAHRKQPVPKTLRAARSLAPAVVAVGLVLLMIDAKAGFQNPARFFYLITNLQSVMVWGVIILGVFMVISIIGLVLDFMKKKVPLALEICGLLASLATAAYTGVLLGVVETFPLWHTPILPVLFVVSAAATGLAATLLLGNCFSDERAMVQPELSRTRVALPAVEIVLVLLLLTTTQGAEAGVLSAGQLIGGSYAVAFWLGLVIIGLVVPLAANALNLLKKGKAPHALELVAELCVLIGGFLLRYLVVFAAVPLG